MLLFLDIISSIPEFCVIDDNKIILKQKITKSETDKLSDNIIQSYVEIDKRLNLTKNLKKNFYNNWSWVLYKFKSRFSICIRSHDIS